MTKPIHGLEATDEIRNICGAKIAKRTTVVNFTPEKHDKSSGDCPELECLWLKIYHPEIVQKWLLGS